MLSSTEFQIWVPNRVKEKSSYHSRFSFLFIYFISQNNWLRQKINEKINKGKYFAVLKFACKMIVQEAEGKKKVRLLQVYKQDLKFSKKYMCTLCM